VFVLDAQRWRDVQSPRVGSFARVLAMHWQLCLQRGSAASVHVGDAWMPEIIRANKGDLETPVHSSLYGQYASLVWSVALPTNAKLARASGLRL